MMTSSVPNSDTVLRLCAAADPAPWFPSQYAQEAVIDRDSLDEPLNQLRIAGLVRIGGWEAGRGQCYVLTDAGRAAVAAGPALPRILSAAVSVAAALPRAGRLTAWDRGEAVRAVFLSGPARAPVLFALVASQVIVFGIGLSIVLRLGAPVSQYVKNGLMPDNFAAQGDGIPSPLAPLILDDADLARGQWWRLLTCALVHFGILHLGMNIYAHLAIGPLVERMYGSARFLVLYVLSALGGGIAASLLSSENAATAGSSGALCGLIGGFAGFVLLNRRHLGSELYDHCRNWLGNTIIILVLFSMLARVSWQGHLGGAVAGFVSGVLLTYHRFGTAEQRWAALLGLVLLPIAGLAPLVEKGILRLPPPAADRRAESEPPAALLERPDFARRVAIPTEQMRSQALAALAVAVPLRDQLAARRDPTDVGVARNRLAILRADQDRARAEINQAGPYQNPVDEGARRAALAYLAAAANVTAAYDACLARGAKWKVAGETGEADEWQLQQLVNKELEADLRWRRLCRQATASP